MDSLTKLVKEKYIAKKILDFKEDLEFNEIIDKYNGRWYKISQDNTLPENFIRRYREELDLVQILCYNKNLREEFLAELAGDDGYYWHFISYFQSFSDEFRAKYNDKIEQSAMEFRQHFLFE